MAAYDQLVTLVEEFYMCRAHRKTVPGVRERSYSYEKEFLFLLYSHTTPTFTSLLAPHSKKFCNPR